MRPLCCGNWLEGSVAEPRPVDKKHEDLKHVTGVMVREATARSISWLLDLCHLFGEHNHLKVSVQCVYCILFTEYFF